MDQCRVDVNEVDPVKQGTALHFAALRGRMEVVKFLCERGADVNLESGTGNTPYDIALRQGHTEVAAYLKTRMDTIKKDQ